MLKSKKQVICLLNLNYGIGFYRSRLLLKYCGINMNYNLRIRRYKRWQFEEKIKTLLKIKGWLLFAELQQRRRDYFFFIKKLFNFYKFLRLRYGLPLRGQRTHSNRQTIARLAKFFLYNELNDKLIKKRKKFIFKRKKRQRNFLLNNFFNKKKKKKKNYRLNIRSSFYSKVNS
jgi:ribosomal protein S13